MKDVPFYKILELDKLRIEDSVEDYRLYVSKEIISNVQLLSTDRIMLILIDKCNIYFIFLVCGL